MAFASLGSGSKGNSTLLRCGDVLHLIDVGFSMRDTRDRMESLGVQFDDLSCIWITHEHGDHIRGLGPLARKSNCKIHLTAGTFRGLKDQRLPCFEIIDPDRELKLDADIRVRPFTVPHDANQPCQYRFDYKGKSLTMLTDLGRATPHIHAVADQSNAMIVEFNHDPELLRLGGYPPALQRRIAGGWGHLSNEKAAQLLRSSGNKLSQLRLGHLSESNNCPDLALEVAQTAVDQGCEVAVLAQHAASGWVEIH